MKPIISSYIRVRHPEFFTVGDYSIIDNFCYFSTKVHIGVCSHIASGCSIAGGLTTMFTLGDFCSLSSGTKIWCTSDSFADDIITIVPPGMDEIKTHLISGDVVFDNYTATGSNTVVMPDNHIPEGTVIGALSFVPAHFRFQPWSVYAGVPVRLIKSRNRDTVMEQAKKLHDFIYGKKNENV